MVRLGYCCQNLSIPSQFRTTTLSWCRKNPDLARQKIIDIVTHNINELRKILNWNIENNIFVYRLTSDFVPLADHPEFTRVWQEIRQLDMFRSLRADFWRYEDLGGRIGMHPSQFTVLSSDNPKVVEQSIAHLNYHSELMDMIGMSANCYNGINIHVSNGSKGQRVAENVRMALTQLSPRARQRLTFETEETGYWTWQNLLQFGVPIVLDFHHNRINNQGESWQEAFEGCRATWPSWLRPLTHYSEGREHPLDKAHSDYIKELPAISQDYNFDIELECKKKDWALLRYRYANQ